MLGPHCKITYVEKQPLIYVTKISCYYILNDKEKILNNFSKILKKYFAAIGRTTIDICYVIKTRVGFEIAEMTRFSNYFSNYSFAL